MTPKPCSICGSIEYTRSYVTKDGSVICDLHGIKTAFDVLLDAVGVEVGKLVEEEEE